MDAIRKTDEARQNKEREAREQAASLGALFAGIAERLRSQDPDFHSNDIAALVDAARALGAAHSAVDSASERLTVSDPSPDKREGG